MTWALLLLTTVAPTVLLTAVWSLIPSAEEPPRWRVALAERLERTAARLRRERPAPEDPFQTLRVQERLGVVAAHVAYDQLLAEACRMAGVEVLPAAKGDPAERFREEMALAERGWTW